MNQRTAKSLVRANVLAAGVFGLFLVGFAFVSQPGPDPTRAVLSTDVFRAVQSGQDATTLRAHLQSCIDAHFLLIGPAQERSTLLRFVEAFLLVGVIIFGANAISIRQAVTNARSNL